MARSVRSTELFRNEEDYEIFFKIMKRTMEKYPFCIHSYCLMTTHFHLLITTKSDEIWKLMKRLMQSYAMYFNRKYRTKEGSDNAMEQAKQIQEDCAYNVTLDVNAKK